MAFNSFSLLEDIVDDNPQTVAFSKKAKQTAGKQAQELQEKPSYSCPQEKKKYEISIQKRNNNVAKSMRLVKEEKQYIEGWKMWLEVEKMLVLNEDENAYFSSRDKEGQQKGLLDQRQRIQEAERWSKEEERLFLEEWSRLLKEERNYIEGWKRWLDVEEEEKQKDMRYVRSWIEGRQTQIREEENLYLEASWRWVKEEKDFIKENRRWVLEEDTRISMEKKNLEREKCAPFSSFSRVEQAYILKQRRNVANERKVISAEEMVVVEAEKRIKEEEKRIEAVRKVIEKKNQESWASISKQEKEKIVKQTLFVHHKISRPPSGQYIPEKKSRNLDQNRGSSEQSKVKETEEDQVICVEQVIEGEKLEETKSETSEGKRNKKKKKLIVKSKEEENEETRKEADMMKKMKTLEQYEEDLIKKKVKLEEKMKIVGEVRKVDIAEEFKSMTIIGKKKETINGFLSNGIKNNLSNGHKKTSL